MQIFAIVAELWTKYFTIVARLRLNTGSQMSKEIKAISLSASVAKWRLLARVQLSDLRQDMSEHGLGKVGLIICPLINF